MQLPQVDAQLFAMPSACQVLTLVLVLVATCAALMVAYYATCAMYLVVTWPVRKALQWWRLRPVFVPFKASETNLTRLDLTDCNGRVEYWAGKVVLILKRGDVEYIVPILPSGMTPPRAQPEKEQATTSKEYFLTDASAIKQAPCLLTFYEGGEDGGMRLLGQGVYTELNAKGSPKRILLTSHQWQHMECAMRTDVPLFVRGPRKTIRLTREHLSLVSKNGSPDEETDVVVCSIPASFPAALGLKATRIVSKKAASPLLYWRDDAGKVRMSASSTWERQIGQIDIRRHNAYTLPGASGSPLLTSSGELIGLHIGACSEAGRNYAVDLFVLFPVKGSRKESPHWNADEPEVDPEADANHIVRDFSDPYAPLTYFEDAQGRIGLTTRELMVDRRGRTWADIDDDDDDEDSEPLVFRTREQWEREKVEFDNEIDDGMQDGPGGNFVSNFQQRRMNRLAAAGKETSHPPDRREENKPSAVAAPAPVATTAAPIVPPAPASESVRETDQASSATKSKRRRNKRKAKKTENSEAEAREQTPAPLAPPQPAAPPKAAEADSTTVPFPPKLAENVMKTSVPFMQAYIMEMFDQAICEGDLNKAMKMQSFMEKIQKEVDSKRARAGSQLLASMVFHKDFPAGTSQSAPKAGQPTN